MRTYWRGYIDAQYRTDYDTGDRVARSKNKKTLTPLSKLLNSPIEDYRGQFQVRMPQDWGKQLPAKFDLDYIRGWWAAQGSVYKKPFKITISGVHVKNFRDIAAKISGLTLPRVQRPRKTSKSYRLTVTGDKARQLHKILS